MRANFCEDDVCGAFAGWTGKVIGRESSREARRVRRVQDAQNSTAQEILIVQPMIF